MIWMKLKLTYTFSNFDEIQGLLAMIKSFKFAFYFSCHIKMIIMKEIGIYFYGVKILLH